MKRVLTIVSALLVAASPAFADNYGWSLSGSATEPCQPVPLGSLQVVYLWFNYATDDGMSAMEANLTTSANYSVLGFNVQNGYLNAGNQTNLLLAVGGCPTGPVVAGAWNLFDLTGTGGFGCLAGANVTVDCDTVNPVAWPHGVSGWNNQGGTACSVLVDGGDGCNPPVVSVEDTSWGSVKSLYR